MISQKHRFHGQKGITRVYRQGETVRGSQMSLKYARNTRSGHFRAAVVVSRKVHKSAVVRNKIRRRVYETIRELASQISNPYDLVFIIYSDALATVDFSELQTDIKLLLEKADVIGN